MGRCFGRYVCVCVCVCATEGGFGGGGFGFVGGLRGEGIVRRRKGECVGSMIG